MSLHEGDGQVVQGSGNIFADLNVELTPEDFIKIEIAREITRVIQARKYTQMEVAHRLGTSQARVSDITRGKLARFKADRLLQYLLSLGINLDVCTSDASPDHGDTRGKVRFHTGVAYG